MIRIFDSCIQKLDWMHPNQIINMRLSKALIEKHQLKDCSVKLERLIDYDGTSTSSNQTRPDLYNVVGHYNKLKICLICHKTFSLMSDLKIHQHFIHTNHPTLQETLKYSFIQKISKSKHNSDQYKGSQVRKVNKKPWVKKDYVRPLKYKCDMCGIRFAKPHKLKEHYEAVHLKLRPCKCKFCGERFSNKYILMNHITMSHLTINRYQCPLCPSEQVEGKGVAHRFAIKSWLIYHIKAQHYDQLMSMAGLNGRGMINTDAAPVIELTPSLKVDTRGYECRECGAVFKHQVHYYRHVKYKHPHRARTGPQSYSLPRFVCHHCPTGTTDDKPEVHDSIDHQLSVDGNHENEQELEDKQLPFRPSFASAEALGRHVKDVHMSVKSFFCPTCRQGYCTKIGRDMHVKRAHNSLVATQPCPAPGCDKSFTSIPSLTRHFKTFHSIRGPHYTTDHVKEEDATVVNGAFKLVKKYECHICRRSYTAKCALTRHVQINHDGRRDHECHLCESRFPDTFTLNRHLSSQVHSDVLTTPCHYCDRRFQNESELKLHLKVVKNHAPPKVQEEEGETFNYFCNICRSEKNKETQKQDEDQEIGLDDEDDLRGVSNNGDTEKDVRFRFFIELELHHQTAHPGEPMPTSYKKFVTSKPVVKAKKTKTKEAKVGKKKVEAENKADDNLGMEKEPPPALCEECGQITKTARGLAKHKLFKHGPQNDSLSQLKPKAKILKAQKLLPPAS